MALHNEIGHLGEDATCEYLKKNGYKIVERNWRLGNIEIDVIAEDYCRIKDSEKSQGKKSWPAREIRQPAMTSFHPQIVSSANHCRLFFVSVEAYLSIELFVKKLNVFVDILSVCRI